MGHEYCIHVSIHGILVNSISYFLWLTDLLHSLPPLIASPSLSAYDLIHFTQEIEAIQQERIVLLIYKPTPVLPSLL